MYSVSIEISKDKDNNDSCCPGTSNVVKNDKSATVKDDNDEQDIIEFSLGNPSVEHITGIIHLYKYNSSSTLTLKKELSSQVCVLAVPSEIGIKEFCSLCGAYVKLMKEISFLRREKSRNIVYMVYVKFNSEESAQSFVDEYQGKPFSSFDEVVWKIVYISSIEYLDEEISKHNLNPENTELPTCPVCLERLDENISGIITTVCNHMFHNECLMRWGDISCPVCRHCMQRPSNSQCSVCGVTKDLWICLICGHVGCGRYKCKHAIDHWQNTQHCYALELDTQRVWDYVGDGYVHRLVRSKTDGKLVEVTSPEMCGSNSNGDALCNNINDIEKNEAIVASKIESVSFEYNHLLTTQLESQREYFENVLVESRTESDMKLKNLNEQLIEKEKTVADALEKSKKSLKIEKDVEKKYQELETNLKETLKEKEFLKMLNDRLILNQKEWKEKFDNMKKELENDIKLKDERIKELKDENHDLMVFIEGQKTIEKHSGELSGASVAIPPTPELDPEHEQHNHSNNRSNNSSHNTSHNRKNRRNNRTRNK